MPSHGASCPDGARRYDARERRSAELKAVLGPDQKQLRNAVFGGEGDDEDGAGEAGGARAGAEQVLVRCRCARASPSFLVPTLSSCVGQTRGAASKEGEAPSDTAETTATRGRARGARVAGGAAAGARRESGRQGEEGCASAPPAAFLHWEFACGRSLFRPCLVHQFCLWRQKRRPRRKKVARKRL